MRFWPTSLDAIRVLLDHGASLNSTCDLTIMQTLQSFGSARESVLEICMNRTKITNEQKYELLKLLLDYAVIKKMDYKGSLDKVPLDFIEKAYRHGHSEVAMTIAKLKHSNKSKTFAHLPGCVVQDIVKYAY